MTTFGNIMGLDHVLGTREMPEGWTFVGVFRTQDDCKWQGRYEVVVRDPRGWEWFQRDDMPPRALEKILSIVSKGRP